MKPSQNVVGQCSIPLPPDAKIITPANTSQSNSIINDFDKFRSQI